MFWMRNRLFFITLCGWGSKIYTMTTRMHRHWLLSHHNKCLRISTLIFLHSLFTLINMCLCKGDWKWADVLAVSAIECHPWILNGTHRRVLLCVSPCWRGVCSCHNCLLEVRLGFHKAPRGYFDCIKRHINKAEFELYSCRRSRHCTAKLGLIGREFTHRHLMAAGRESP